MRLYKFLMTSNGILKIAGVFLPICLISVFVTNYYYGHYSPIFLIGVSFASTWILIVALFGIGGISLIRLHARTKKETLSMLAKDLPIYVLAYRNVQTNEMEFKNTLFPEDGPISSMNKALLEKFIPFVSKYNPMPYEVIMLQKEELKEMMSNNGYKSTILFYTENELFDGLVLNIDDLL